MFCWRDCGKIGKFSQESLSEETRSQDGMRCKTAINVGLQLLEHYHHGSYHHTVDSDISAALCTRTGPCHMSTNKP